MNSLADRLISYHAALPSEGTLYVDGQRVNYKIEAECPVLGLPGKRYTFNGRVSYVWKKERVRDENRKS